MKVYKFKVSIKRRKDSSVIKERIYSERERGKAEAFVAEFNADPWQMNRYATIETIVEGRDIYAERAEACVSAYINKMWNLK